MDVGGTIFMKRVRIVNLPNDLQTLLWQIAVDGGGWPGETDADIQAFGRIELPVARLPLSAFPSEVPYDLDRPLEPFLESGPSEWPPVVVAHRTLLDGAHRLAAARELKLETLDTIDLSCIVKPETLRGFGWLGRMRTPLGWTAGPCKLPKGARGGSTPPGRRV